MRKNFPPSSADAKFRSRYLQGSIRASLEATTSEPRESIPLKLIQYWDESKAPTDVQRCLDSWRTIESVGFERLIFDNKKARAFIDHHFNEAHVRAFDSCTHPAMRSDYFRLCYLAQNGGLYVDADDELKKPEAILPLTSAGLLQLQPLCYQLSTDLMVVPEQHAGATTDDFIFYVANDPIFAPVNHPVIDLALAQATSRLIAANGTSRDIQWLTGPGNLSEALVRHMLQEELSDAQPSFRFVHSWVQIAPGDWTLGYRNDHRNWRLWIKEDAAQ